MKTGLCAVTFLLGVSNAAPFEPRQGKTGDSTRPFGNSFGLAGQNNTFDYVIVGGGTSGLVAAMRLSAGGKYSVAVVEAGSFYQTAGNVTEIPAYESEFLEVPLTVEWGINTKPQAQIGGRSVRYSQGKTFGGSSARNGMAYQRGTIGSYDRWADLVGDSSYSLSNLLPYFKKGVHFTPPDISLRGGPPVAFEASAFDASSSGPLHVSFWNYYAPVSSYIARGLKRLGFSETSQIQSGSLLGYAQFPATLHPDKQIRDSSQTSYLDAAIAANTFSNLQLYPDTLAKHILFAGNKTATGVHVSTAGAEYVLSARKEVIVASGPLRSPQLLLASGIGPAETLQKFNIPAVSTLSGVGQNLIDHPGYGTLFSVNAESQHRLFNNATFANEAYKEFYSSRSGALTAFASNYLLWEKLPNNTQLSNETRTVLNSFPADWPDIQYIFNTAGPADTTPGDLLSLGVVILKPSSVGSVTLNSSSDTAENPLVDVAWFTTKADQELGIAAVRRLRLFANATGVLQSELSPGAAVQTDEQILEFVKGAASPSHHAVGTCKMGKSSDESAVVDTHGCVMGGVSGLRIIDASIMPVLLPGQPMSTVCKFYTSMFHHLVTADAIAEKLSDDILSGHQCLSSE
ncbi:alcohol oxidase [Daldinia vernicosa]|uniref:alcohol oxidase n=1 Tax=Daldinia vernicosa TaxID=114800 RepID=UPI002008B07A|nr:alcohol oxidase [Daldinia vernicosa]KAI0847742.1 alcohol oxidase [Daldinia vernicosa]